MVVFGRTFYARAEDLAVKLTAMTGVRHVLQQMQGERLDRDRVPCLLRALDDSSFQGMAGGGTAAPNPELFTRENILAIADALEKRFPPS